MAQGNSKATSGSLLLSYGTTEHKELLFVVREKLWRIFTYEVLLTNRPFLWLFIYLT